MAAEETRLAQQNDCSYQARKRQTIRKINTRKMSPFSGRDPICSEHSYQDLNIAVSFGLCDPSILEPLSPLTRDNIRRTCVSSESSTSPLFLPDLWYLTLARTSGNIPKRSWIDRKSTRLNSSH